LDRGSWVCAPLRGGCLEGDILKDFKATLALCIIAAAISSLGLAGLARGDGSTLAALERVPVHTSDRDEDPVERRKRKREIAEAIDAATPNLDERAWLIMTARRESGLAEFVTEDHDRCSTGQGGVCDGGSSFGAWQQKRMLRTETKAEQAVEALRRFRRAANYCSSRGVDYWSGGTSQYALGRTFEWGGCAWPEAKERVAEMLAVRGRL
jgi:hypothetical protein